MALAPKNWSSFQHYKDRAPAWIKLHRGLLDDYEFACLPVASRALAPCLWLLASEYDGGQITASLKAIAFRLRMSEDELRTALKPLVDSGFFIDASGMLADCKQEAIPEREKQEKIEVEVEEIIGRSAKKPTRPANDDFEELYAAYPKRKGANPKAPALAKYQAAIKQGGDHKHMLSALKAGVGYDKDKIGTEYIPRMSTWLSEKRWQEYLNGADADNARRAVAAETIAFMASKGYELDATGTGWKPTEKPPDPPPEPAHVGPIPIPALRRA
jgi:hypothetical protein